ncbi:hypothetical protein K491DRAFT_687894 [Lophiostoma macrostomum CBS 122681]|uniref:Uncharacterized protein n=1 Tax=Lophiostoma macrostomum CBS 122681 TaxID=1314788 RepID=A0A6A6TPA3_9PLEO|nr:hypothetical protein K491DRAFT_687894 [Lophiostoma macrostomum CBS 122681]
MATTFNPFTAALPARPIQQAPSRCYYILRYTYERNNNPSIMDSGVILLPEVEISTWANFGIYLVNHVKPLYTAVERGQVMNKTADPRFSKIVSSMREMAFLMHPTGGRIKIPEHSVTHLDRFVKRIKPLFDEYAMLVNADDKAKPVLQKQDNFGTWADQILDGIERYGGMKGFHWKLLGEVEQDPELVDYSLEFRAKLRYDDDGLEDGDLLGDIAVP